MRYSLSLIGVLLLSACSLAPTMHTPNTETPEAYKEAGNWIKAAPADQPADKQWWTVFSNPELSGLEEKAGQGNQDLKQALARLDEARAVVETSSSARLPSVGLGIDGQRVRNSETVINPRGHNVYNDYAAVGTVAFETDLWGRVRNQVKADVSRAKASENDVTIADLSIRSELASQYFTLRGYDDMQRLLDETVTSYQKAFELTQNRHKGGIAMESDVTQAETQLNNAKTRAADTRMRRVQTEHAIAVLIGQLPSSFNLSDQKTTSSLPVLSPGLPSTLLQQRPDVAAAERQMEAANAEIGVARAAYFPDLTLSGSGGVETGIIKNLFDAPSLLWAFGASATMPLFDGGRISGLTHQAHARYDQSIAGYRQTVLVAYQEVEDALSALYQLEIENQTQQAATTAAEKTLYQIRKRYDGGVANYLEVVVAQNTALDAEIQSININTARLIASVNLIKALGGTYF